MISTDLLRRPLLEYLRDATEMIVTDPEPQLKRPEKTIRALEEGLDALHTMILALHTSSNDSYAVDDLPLSDKAALAQIRHNLKIARLLYGPQAAGE